MFLKTADGKQLLNTADIKFIRETEDDHAEACVRDDGRFWKLGYMSDVCELLTGRVVPAAAGYYLRTYESEKTPIIAWRQRHAAWDPIVLDPEINESLGTLVDVDMYAVQAPDGSLTDLEHHCHFENVEEWQRHWRELRKIEKAKEEAGKSKVDAL